MPPAGCESDEGGSLADLPTRRRAQLEYRARLHRRILLLDSALELRGFDAEIEPPGVAIAG